MLYTMFMLALNNLKLNNKFGVGKNLCLDTVSFTFFL